VLNSLDYVRPQLGINVKERGLVGNGTTNDYTALNALLTAIGSTPTELLIDSGTYKISSNITIPSNIKLIFANGAMLSPDGGITITINGEINAGLHQIFTGSGSIAGTPKNNEIYPEWFGAIGNGSTNDYTAIDKALTFAPKSVELTKATYLTDSTIVIPSGKKLHGIHRTIIKANLDIDIVELRSLAMLSDVFIWAAASTFTKSAILFDGAQLVKYCKAERIHIYTSDLTFDSGNAIYMKCLDTPSSGDQDYVFGCRFADIVIDGFGYGIKMEEAALPYPPGLVNPWINANDFVNIYINNSQ